MRRIPLSPRPDWQQIAERNGFFFHHVGGDIYWDESACYAFSLEEIEAGLEDPAQELADMCVSLVADVVHSEELLEKLAIPPLFWDMVRDSWRRNEPRLYGRFDFPTMGTARPSFTNTMPTRRPLFTRPPISSGSGWRIA